MGGQETLLLVARHPHLLAGAAAFDPATDMARRYRDFAALPHGRELQALARREIGGTPAQVPQAVRACAAPTTTREAIAGRASRCSSTGARATASSATSVSRPNELAVAIDRDDEHERLWDFHGDWSHTAEMRSERGGCRARSRASGCCRGRTRRRCRATRSRLA